MKRAKVVHQLGRAADGKGGGLARTNLALKLLTAQRDTDTRTNMKPTFANTLLT